MTMQNQGGPAPSGSTGGSGMGQAGVDDGRGARGVHEGFPPAMEPVEPMGPAPARFGVAGISAGEDRFYKTTVPRDPRGRQKKRGDAIAQGLGWFSLALGVVEVVGARRLAEWLGMPEKSGLLRAFGLREIGHGVGILGQHRPEDRRPWVWTRVAGDALDLGVLATGLDKENPRRGNVAAAIGAVAGVTALDVACAAMLTDPGDRAAGGFRQGVKSTWRARGGRGRLGRGRR